MKIYKKFWFPMAVVVAVIALANFGIAMKRWNAEPDFLDTPEGQAYIESLRNAIEEQKKNGGNSEIILLEPQPKSAGEFLLAAGFSNTGLIPEGRVSTVRNDTTLEQQAVLTDLRNDLIFGREDAPNTIVEYSSFSCGYCVKMHKDNTDKLKSDYIDRGLVKYVFRPIIDKNSIKGVMLLHCTRTRPETYGLMDQLFKEHSKWMGTSAKNEEALKKIATDNGISEAAFKNCIDDTAITQTLIAKQNFGLRILGLKSTPTTFFNNERTTGLVEMKYFSGYLD